MGGVLGGSTTVAAQATFVVITGSFPSTFSPTLSTGWDTSYRVMNVGASGFRAEFSHAVPTGGCVLYWSATYDAVGANLITASLDICNMALLLIGDATITSLAQNVPRATLLNQLYAPTLDEALQAHNWNFASVRTTLTTALTCAPAWDFTYQYQLPTGACSPYCLMVLATNLAEDEPWRVEYGCVTGTSYRVLVTDGCQPSILYIGRIDDVTLWPPLFRDAFTYELAFRIAYPLTRNAELSAVLQKEKEERWKKARSRDAQESRALTSLLSSSITSVRT